MNELTIRATQIVPYAITQVLAKGQALAGMLLVVAEQTLKADSETFERDYNGAEREAMIAERALKIQGLMSVALDDAGARLMDRLLEKGEHHPDLRGSAREFVDEMLSQADQQRLYQYHYFVTKVIPEAQKLGIDVNEWMMSTHRTKLAILVPEFRYCMEDPEFPEEDREGYFKALVALSAKTISEIRTARRVVSASGFKILETPAGEGWEWVIPFMTQSTRDWMMRRVQPHGRRENGG